MTEKTETQTTELAPQEIAREPMAGDQAAPEAATYDPPAPDAPAADAPADAEPKRFAIRSNVNRAAIGEKFAQRRGEAEKQLEFDGSFAQPEILAGRMVQEQPDEPAAPAAEPEPPAAAPARTAAPAAPQAPKYKLRVDDQDMEVSADRLAELSGLEVADVVASPERAKRIAQMDLAAARRLETAKELVHTARETSVRRGLSAEGSNQPEPQTADGEPDPAAPPNQEDEAKQIAERIQFGNAEDAAEAVRQLLAKKQPDATPEAVRKVIYDDKRNADLAVSNAHYTAFTTANEDLFKDPRSKGALTEQYLEEVRKDLRDLGYTDDRIPTDLSRLREEHRFHRISGLKVRDTAKLLADSKQALDAWRGGSLEPASTAPGKIAVNVDRTERRQAIPQQPARSAVPPQSTTSPKPAQSVRREAVNDILGKRRRIVINH